MSISGIGQRQIETFMAVIGVPALHSSSMKASENEMASHIQSVAEETCTEVLMEFVWCLRLFDRFSIIYRRCQTSRNHLGVIQIITSELLGHYCKRLAAFHLNPIPKASLLVI